MKEYYLIVEWDLNFDDEDLLLEYEWISDIVGVESDGSGAGFGRRDVSFTLPSEEAAKAAKAEIEEQAKTYTEYKNLSVEIYPADEDE